MSQSPDFVVDDGDGSSLLSQLGSMLPALASSNSGPASPPSPYGGMMWLDSSSSPPILKMRNYANTAWIAISSDTVPATTIRGNSSGSAAPEADITMATLRAMMGFSETLAANQIQNLPGGAKFQKGYGATGASGVSLVFPAAFTTLPAFIAIANAAGPFFVTYQAPTTTGVFVQGWGNSTGGTGVNVAFSWIAMGY